MNSYEPLVKSIRELIDENAALLNRCKVAEDLNKVYVRMYLEMQQKYDDCVYWTTTDFEVRTTCDCDDRC